MYIEELNVAKSIAMDAGDIMKHYFYADQQRTTKSDGTPVTIADTTINTLVIDRLKTVFPADVVIGEEESTGGYGAGRRWFCDPIDGTKAFSWGVPTALFSLGLVVDGKPVVSVCYEPMLDRLYSAVTGEGAYMNTDRLHVNQQGLEDGILAIASAPADIRNNEIVHRILDEGITTAIFSGAAYKASAVADGRFVGYVEHKVNAYDMAAVELIVREAGGMVTGLDGKPNDYSAPIKGSIVSNGYIHDELIRLVKGEA
jgi:myo-inositol-1(or 4)-monophosphatase